jgi:hypothetical protein
MQSITQKLPPLVMNSPSPGHMRNTTIGFERLYNSHLADYRDTTPDSSTDDNTEDHA